ncbi:MAG: hypothetical protein BWZ05_02312 [Bacteroidetes bacterium ADurb.BinA245]|nr:MAG: hypothetical protein BWZ05_02312 [Bacteroidetes bacterium ADurb.BinA245]
MDFVFMTIAVTAAASVPSSFTSQNVLWITVLIYKSFPPVIFEKSAFVSLKASFMPIFIKGSTSIYSHSILNFGK